jgi:hypothetical protein
VPTTTPLATTPKDGTTTPLARCDDFKCTLYHSTAIPKSLGDPSRPTHCKDNKCTFKQCCYCLTTTPKPTMSNTEETTQLPSTGSTHESTTTPDTCLLFKCGLWHKGATPSPNAPSQCNGACTFAQCCLCDTTTITTTTTTTTTTTPQTCSTYTCPPNWVKKEKPQPCWSWGCTPSWCCVNPTTTPLTTTIASCSTFTCAAGWEKKEKPQPCWQWGCTPSWCCLPPTTTPPTTTPLTCANFPCQEWDPTAKAKDAKTKCDTQCSFDECCEKLTTTTTQDTCSSVPCAQQEPTAISPHPNKTCGTACTFEECCVIPTTTPAAEETCDEFPCKLYHKNAVNINSGTTCAGKCTFEGCCRCGTTTPAPSDTCETYPCHRWDGFVGIWEAYGGNGKTARDYPDFTAMPECRDTISRHCCCQCDSPGESTTTENHYGQSGSAVAPSPAGSDPNYPGPNQFAQAIPLKKYGDQHTPGAGVRQSDRRVPLPAFGFSNLTFGVLLSFAALGCLGLSMRKLARRSMSMRSRLSLQQDVPQSNHVDYAPISLLEAEGLE